MYIYILKKYIYINIYMILIYKYIYISSVLLKEKLKLINNFHINLDYPLHVLYDMYNVCVAHLTDKLIFYGPHA